MSRQRYVLISILFFHSVNTYMDRVCIASAVDHIMKDLSMTAERMDMHYFRFLPDGLLTSLGHVKH